MGASPPERCCCCCCCCCAAGTHPPVALRENTCAGTMPPPPPRGAAAWWWYCVGAGAEASTRDRCCSGMPNRLGARRCGPRPPPLPPPASDQPPCENAWLPPSRRWRRCRCRCLCRCRRWPVSPSPLPPPPAPPPPPPPPPLAGTALRRATLPSGDATYDASGEKAWEARGAGAGTGTGAGAGAGVAPRLGGVSVAPPTSRSDRGVATGMGWVTNVGPPPGATSDRQ